MNEITPKNTLTTTRIIFMALLVGKLVFALVVVSLFDGTPKFEILLNEPLTIVLLIMAVTILPLSIIVPKKLVQNIKVTDDLQKKLTAYQTACIQKAAFCEGLALFGIVVTLFQENLFPLSISALTILYMASLYPSVSNIQKLIPLSAEEINSLS